MSEHCYLCGNKADDGFMIMGRFMCRQCEKNTLEDGTNEDNRDVNSRNFLVRMAGAINQSRNNWGVRP